MTILIALAPIGLFTAGISIGIIGLMCVAVRREHSHHTLSKQPTDNVTRAGRLLNGVYVRAPHRAVATNQDTALPGERGDWVAIGLRGCPQLAHGSRRGRSGLD